VLQPTAVKSKKWRFSGLNHPNFGFFVLVPESPIHTGLIYVKNPISQAWAPLICRVFSYLSVDKVHHKLQNTVVYGHILADAGEKEVKLLENGNIQSIA
jgi:hypothetical protein